MCIKLYMAMKKNCFFKKQLQTLTNIYNNLSTLKKYFKNGQNLYARNKFYRKIF